jgi:hypothetical protein
VQTGGTAIINLQTAKALDLTTPPQLLDRADKLIAPFAAVLTPLVALSGHSVSVTRCPLLSVKRTSLRSRIFIHGS